jgi:hypothetical protein
MPEFDRVNHLQQLIMHGGEEAFAVVPRALELVIAERQWAGRTDRDGKPFVSFEAFVAHRLWWGLESSVDDLLAFCRKRPDVQAMIKAEIGAVGQHGGDRKEQGSNTTLDRGATYTLRRLKRDRPDLAAQVIAGKLTAHAAAIEAGFRTKPTPFEIVIKLLPKLTADELRQLRAEIADD